MAGEGWEIVHKCHGIYRFGLCQLGLRRRSSFAVFWTAPVICLLLWPSQIYYRTQIWPKQHPSAFFERPTWTPKRRRFLEGCRLQRPIDYLGGIATVGFWSAAHCSNHLQPARRPSHLASPQSGAPRPFGAVFWLETKCKVREIHGRAVWCTPHERQYRWCHDWSSCCCPSPPPLRRCCACRILPSRPAIPASNRPVSGAMTEWIEAWFHPERAGTGLPDPGVMTVKQMPVVAGLVLAEVSTVMGAAACCLLRTVARRLKGGRRQEAMCWGAHAALEAPRQQHHAPSAHTPAARPCPCLPALPAGAAVQCAGPQGVQPAAEHQQCGRRHPHTHPAG